MYTYQGRTFEACLSLCHTISCRAHKGYPRTQNNQPTASNGAATKRAALSLTFANLGDLL